MLQIEPPPPTFASVSDALMIGAGGYWQNTDFYNTQFKVLRSKGLGEKVVARLKLTDQEPFKSSIDPAALFMSHVGVEPVPESRLVLVTVTHRDPREAALWANTLGDVYIEQSLATRVESARKAMEWLQERLAATQQGMRDAQDRLFQSYRSQDLFVPEGSVTAVSTSIAKLQEDFVQAQARRIAIEAALKQASEMRARNEDLDALPQVAADPVVTGFNSQLASLSVELGRLGEKYREGHPEVQKVKAQIEQLKKAQARRAPRRSSTGSRPSTRSSRSARPSCATRSTSEKAQAANQSRKTTELEALRKEADSQKSLYEVLLQKLNETDIAASIRSNNVSVVDRASPPQFPVRPQKRTHRARGAAARARGRARPGAGARPAREHDPRPGGDRALPAPRPAGRGAALRGGARLARDRGLPEPPDRAHLRAARRARAGGAGDRHGAPGGQDHHDREPGAPARRLGREDGGGRLRPPARAAAPAARPVARAGLHRLLRAQGAGRGGAAADHDRRTSSRSRPGRCRPTRRRCSRASSSARCWPSSRPSSSGCSSTRRRSPR